MSKKQKPYRLYSVAAGTLHNLKYSFDSIDDCDSFIQNKIIGYKTDPNWRTKFFSSHQLVLQHYSDKYKARIVKIYN